MRGAHGRAAQCPVVAQIVFSEIAWIRGMTLYAGHQVAGDRTLMEDLGAVPGDGGERVGERGMAQQCANRQCPPFAVVKQCAGVGIVTQPSVAGEKRVQPRAEPEPLACMPDRMLEQPDPRQHAMVAMRKLQHSEEAGCANGSAADDGRCKSQWTARRIDKPVRARRCGGCLPTVVGLDPPSRRIVMQQKASAAHARGLGLDQRKHCLRGNGSVDRTSALCQHRKRGLAGKRMRSDRQKLTGTDHGLAFSPARRLGRVTQRGLGERRYRRPESGRRRDGLRLPSQYGKGQAQRDR